MVIPQYTLAWDAYQKNICKGLGSLQERGEFVDMTLAADGHYVKVHKMVMSLVSPYMKELITSADCPHPVIFLYNITYRTLSSILEYIYTGQVSVCRDELSNLIQAGKALHIKGLIEMVESCSPHIEDSELATVEPISNASIQNHDYDSASCAEDNHHDGDIGMPINTVTSEAQDVIEINETCSEQTQDKAPRPRSRIIGTRKPSTVVDSQIQYTMSNQGSLQMVLNRYVYNVRYLYKNSNRRMWRCIFYPKQLRCPAFVITEGDDIVERSCTHNHSFHDKNIMRKIREGKIFSVLKEAQLQTEIQKRTKAAAVSAQETTDDE